MKNPALVLLGAITFGGAAQAATVVPEWQQLEADYARDHGTSAARRDMLSAIPIGTPSRDAEARLSQAGASCRPDRHKADTVRCLIHQYDLRDGAADDVRWLVSMESHLGNLTDMAVTRYVDRHGAP